MTDVETVETRLRAGLEAYGAETADVVSPLPLSEIAERAADGRPGQRRWPRVAVAIVGATAITTGAAAAAVVLPGPVESVLREFRSWGYEANQGAERMASTTAGDFTYEVWRAPLDDGGVCVYDRAIGPDGDVEHGGASSCVPEASAPRTRNRLDVGYPETVFDNSTGRDHASARLHSVSSGQAPVGATEVVYEFDDGTTLTVAPQREGYFITAFPGVRDGARITDVRALAADGHVLAHG